MALPTLTKTWQIVSNQAVGGYGLDYQDNADYMLKLKNALVGFASSPWVVIRSCAYVGGSTWTVSNSDLWTAINEVIWGTSGTANRAWIVLKQAGIMSNFQILIDCIDDNSEFVLYVSPNDGFTGGASNSRPTATDEYQLWNGDHGGGGGGWSGNLNVWQTTDGEAMAWSLVYGNFLKGMGIFCKAQDPISQWTDPWVARFRGTEFSATDVDTSYSNMNAGAQFYTTRGSFYLTAEGIGSSALGNQINYPDEVLGGLQYGIYPIGLFSTTVGFRGRKGELPDIYWVATGQDWNTLPDDTSRQWAIFGDITLPWDGSVLLTA